MAKRNFRGKTVVITGAAGGLGLALAKRFSRSGARLALLDLDGEAVSRAGQELGLDASDHLELACDVSSEEDCIRAFSQIAAHFGGVDVLINNAGITHRSYFADTDSAVMRKVVEVNLFGSMYCTKLCLDSLIENKGLVVVISSVAGFTALDGRAGYAASKHALHGMFDTLRSELRPQGVSVMLVCPTFVATGIGAAALSGDGGRAPRPQATVGRVATAEEIAEGIYQAGEKDQRLLLPSLTGKMSWWLNNLAPALYEKMMSRAVRAEFER